ncbi:MAG: hypothetical protein ABIJ61_13855 [bacterium]
MRNSQKALGRLLTILVGLAMVMLLVNCSGDSISPVANQPATGPARAPGPPGDEATGGDEALNARLDQGAGVAEMTFAVSDLIGAEGGNLEISYDDFVEVRYDDFFYSLDIGSGVLDEEYGVGFQVTRGLNQAGERLDYVSLTPQNVLISGSVTLTIRNAFVRNGDRVIGLNSVPAKVEIYLWNAGSGWTEAGSVVTSGTTQSVSFELSHFGTYALLIYPTDFQDDAS